MIEVQTFYKSQVVIIFCSAIRSKYVSKLQKIVIYLYADYGEGIMRFVRLQKF